MTSTELTIPQKTQKAIDQIRSPEIALGFREALPENVSEAQFTRALATALMDTPQLVNADRTSLVQSAIKCAQDGLLPDGRDAALVVYRTKQGDKYIDKVSYLPMVGGLRRVAAEHGMAIHAQVVHENDEFDPDFENHKANYKRTRLGQDPGKPVGAYAVAQHKDGRRFGPLVMDVNEIERVRAKSRAKDGEAWKNWWDRMAEKTVARRLWKELPFDSKDRERIDRILAADDTDPATMMYGPTHEPIPDEADDPPPNVDPETGEIIEDADWSDGSAEDVPFEGEEPPAEPEEGAKVFGSGRHAGETVQQVYDSGDEGMRYIKWAISSWKTGDIVEDLQRFAEQHPELTS